MDKDSANINYYFITFEGRKGNSNCYCWLSAALSPASTWKYFRVQQKGGFFILFRGSINSTANWFENMICSKTNAKQTT